MKKPVFKGNGNHSIRDLERLCNEYEEFCHQRQIERQQIEQRNKDQVEVLGRAYKEIKALAINQGLTENEFNSVLILVDLKEQLKKSAEL